MNTHTCTSRCTSRQTYASLGVQAPARDAGPMEKARAQMALSKARHAAWAAGSLVLCSARKVNPQAA